MQASQIPEIVIVTHLNDVPQLKSHLLPVLSYRNLSVALLHLLSSHCSVFKVQLPTAFAVRFEDPTFQLGLQIQQQICLVGPSGLEPPTLRLSVVRSSQLSYGPVVGTSSISLASGFAESSLISPCLLFLRKHFLVRVGFGRWIGGD